MSVTKRRETWTWDDYLDWEARQELKYELVDGEVYAMTGGSRRHDRIGNNLRIAMDQALEGRSCRPHGPDFKVHAGKNGRYPDALIDCGPETGNDLVASEPVAVFEVLSPSTTLVDQVLKLRDYGVVPSIRTYVILETTRPRALVYRRDTAGCFSTDALELLDGIEAALALPDLGFDITLASLYRNVAFDVSPPAED